VSAGRYRMINLLDILCQERTFCVVLCLYSVQNLLSSKNLKIRIYRTIILPVVVYGCEAWSLT
jgi:hypothetical protein